MASSLLASKQTKAFLAGAVCSAAVLWFLDPKEGSERRRRLARLTIGGALQTSRNAGRVYWRAWKWLAEAAGEIQDLVSGRPVSDAAMQARIRRKLWRMVRRPAAVDVHVDQGTVLLTGSIRASEAAPLISGLSYLPGVIAITNELELEPA